MSIATDHALATIVSILASPAVADVRKKPAQPESTADGSSTGTMAFEPAGYSKTGPGPMTALRFRWTVRRGDGGYYVDETIGADSVPIVSGPMSGEAAIRFADERAAEAQQRFEALKNEMTGQGPTAPFLPSGGGEK